MNIQQALKLGKKYYTTQLDKSFFHLSDLTKYTKQKVVIFGASIVGRAIQKILKQHKIGIEAFVDNNPDLIEKKVQGVPVISFKDLKKKYFSFPVIIASIIYEYEIYNLLVKNKFHYIYPLAYLEYKYPRIFYYRKYHDYFKAFFRKDSPDKIVKVYDLLQDKESKRVYSSVVKFRLEHYFNVKMDDIFSPHPPYFDEDIMKPETKNDNELYVDCGAYPGENIGLFVEYTKNRFDNIFLFEPDKNNYKSLLAKVRKLHDDRIKVENKAVYNKTENIIFYQLGSVESGVGDKEEFRAFSGSISRKFSTTIPAVSLDDYFKDKQPPTFIKMDIEGAEMQALKGAQKIIKKYRPKLTICIYHKPTDLWEIPLMIYKYNPDYRFYVRHYSREVCETVLYAL